MNDSLRIEVHASGDITPQLHHEIIELCNGAYEQDITDMFLSMPDPVHVLGYVGDRLVSHVMWVTRWLQVGNGPLLRTAYVEMVATRLEYRGHGYASRLMRRLAEEIAVYDIGGLCPNDKAVSLYERLGWRFWRGPLFIRHEGNLEATPTEWLMVLQLPQTPRLDFEAPISIEWRPYDLW